MKITENSEYKGLKRVIFFSIQPSRIRHEVMFENVKDYAVQALGSMSMLNMARSNGDSVSVKLSKFDGYKVEDM